VFIGGAVVESLLTNLFAMGSNFTPQKVELTEEKTIGFCNCKHSAGGAFCDGSHSRL